MTPHAHSPAPASVAGPGPARAPEQCPHCRGAVRPGAPWCTQCWADLRAAPEPPAPVEPSTATTTTTATTTATAPPFAVPPPSAPVPQAAPAPPGGRGWPCATCGATNPIDLAACATCGAGFLAAMRADEPPLLSLPGVGDVSRLSRGQRIGLSAGLAVGFALLVLLVGLLLG